ncbi:hypothetical protein TNCV_1900371 [Trichonephila clavipes]|nr:hypothetical protein TNCV_1900371 [Trichonephila clavipes]
MWHLSSLVIVLVQQTVQRGKSIVDLHQGGEEGSDLFFVDGRCETCRNFSLRTKAVWDSYSSRNKIYEWIQCFKQGRASSCDNE